MTPAEFKAGREKLGLSMHQAAAIFCTTKQSLTKWEMPETAKSRIPPSPLACAVMQWMLDGFRPPEFPKVLAAGQSGYRNPKD